MSQYFPKPYEPLDEDINVKFDLSNYATKAEIKNILNIDTSSFALKSNLDNLKTEVDKLDIDKIVPVPVDLSKLSGVAKNNVFKKDVYDKLVTKVNNIDTSGFVLKKNPLSMIQINQNYKIKFLILAVLLKTLIIILKSLK